MGGWFFDSPIWTQIDIVRLLKLRDPRDLDFFFMPSGKFLQQFMASLSLAVCDLALGPQTFGVSVILAT